MALLRIKRGEPKYSQDFDGNWIVDAKSIENLSTVSGSELARLTNAPISPLEFKSQPQPNYIPLLAIDGIVVRVMDMYLISPRTLGEISNNSNPHQDAKSNGTLIVRDRSITIGNTIPVVELDFQSLDGIAAERDRSNIYAGVTEVKYSHKSDLIQGIPKGLIEQINWTLDPNSPKPEDTYTYYKPVLKGDYSVRKLETNAVDETGAINADALKDFLTANNERLTLMREDYNKIKSTFYLGQLPVGDVTLTETKLAVGDGPTQPGGAQSVVIGAQPTITEIKDTPSAILSRQLKRQTTGGTGFDTDRAIANQLYNTIVTSRLGADVLDEAAAAFAQGDVEALRNLIQDNNIE